MKDCKRWLSVLLICGFAFALRIASAQASGLLRADGPYLKDQQGRVVLLRGINISNESKIPPFHPIENLSDVDRIHELGFNAIRLLFIWEAFEPKSGQYDLSYLDRLGSVVKRASDLGIFTIVDFHMDGFSRYTIGGCGSGAPAWTIAPGQVEDPNNGGICKLWNVFEAVQFLLPFQSFDDTLADFYSDRYGARTHYLEAWAKVAHYFSGYKSVIGYDMLNEPWGDEKTQIGPLYEDAAARIRAEDPEAILFVEPEVFTALGWADTALDRPSFGNFVYAPHNYDAVAQALGLSLNAGMAVNSALDRVKAQAKAWNVPLFVGEYGVAGDGGLFLPELIRNYYEHYDREFISSAQWDYSPNWTQDSGDGWNNEDMSIVDRQGNIRDNYVARPFPSAVSGTPIELTNDLSSGPVSGGMDFSWNNAPQPGETDFVIPVLATRGVHHVAGFETEDPDLKCLLSADSSRLSCSSSVSGPHHVHITVQ